MPIGEKRHVRVALEETDETRELIDGWLQAKPGGRELPNRVATSLRFGISKQLNVGAFQWRINNRRVRCSPRDYFVPDRFILPTDLMRPLLARPHDLEVDDAPMPLVVEVWEPPTDDHDAVRKLPGYGCRGDREIWWLHPDEHTLTAWRRPPDGSDAETTQTGGVARPASSPNVAIDLDALFAG